MNVEEEHEFVDLVMILRERESWGVSQGSDAGTLLISLTAMLEGTTAAETYITLPKLVNKVLVEVQPLNVMLEVSACK